LGVLVVKIIIVFLYITLNLQSDSWYKPNITTTWNWQLDKKIDTFVEADIYIVDLFDTSKEMVNSLHKKGRKVIAYFSAGSYESWRSDARKFPKSTLGKKMEGWDESWIDIRAEKIKSIMKERIFLAKKKGFDGVEADNVDGYSNPTGFNISANNQIEYNKFLANQAHKMNLAIALKNDVEQIEVLEPYFDFHINEECYVYNECEKCLPFIKSKKPVFHAEYKLNKRVQICKMSKKLQFQTLILPIDLDGSIYIRCK
jgi:hypothetical protein